MYIALVDAYHLWRQNTICKLKFELWNFGGMSFHSVFYWVRKKKYIAQKLVLGAINYNSSLCAVCFVFCFIIHFANIIPEIPNSHIRLRCMPSTHFISSYMPSKKVGRVIHLSCNESVQFGNHKICSFKKRIKSNVFCADKFKNHK